MYPPFLIKPAHILVLGSNELSLTFKTATLIEYNASTIFMGLCNYKYFTHHFELK